MQNEVINISTDDGHHFDISCYGAKDAKSVLLFFPAMGVEARYYRDWAKSMADAGFLCCISDHRGHGTSSIRPKRGIDFGYQQMIEQDYESAINAILSYADSEKIYLGGHSLGGQLSCLYAGTRNDDLNWLSGIVLIAACTISHSGWSGFQGFMMRFIPHFFSTVARLIGYFPGKRLMFAGTEARQQMLDWSQSGLDGMYQPLGYKESLDPKMQKVTKPIVSISYEGDDYAPRAAVDHLVSKMTGCDISRIHLTDKNSPKVIRDHFKWAKRQPEFTTAILVKELVLIVVFLFKLKITN